MGKATKKQVAFASKISKTLNISLPEQLTFETMQKFINTHIDEYMNINYTVLGERIKNEVSILDYVPLAGFTLKKIGNHGLYTTVEHDSLIIDPYKNCYWFNSRGDADSVIGFVTKYIYNGDAKMAIKELSEKLNNSDFSFNIAITPEASVEKPKELILPPKNSDMRKVFAYLTKSRFINQEIVQDFVTQHMLYQDLKGNCVFVSYDNDIPVFGCLRGTNTYKRFLGDLPGCNYQKGFFINGKGSELIVTESVIDAMSIMSILKEKGLDYKNYSFLSLSGVDKNNALKFHLDHNKKFQSVLLALDNDSAGKRISKLIIKEFADRKDLCITEHYPSSKDWNQEITNFFRFGKPLSDIDFFKKSVTLHIKARKNIIER